MILLTASDVARRWQCDPTTVYRLARCGALASVRIGEGGVRFTVAAVEAYEAAHTAEARPQTWEQFFPWIEERWNGRTATTERTGIR